MTARTAADPALAPLLEVLEGVTCLDVAALAESIAPRPGKPGGRVDGRTREGRAWREQMLELAFAAFELMQAGLAEVIMPADGRHPNEMGITDAGRRYLAEMRAL